MPAVGIYRLKSKSEGQGHSLTLFPWQRAVWPGTLDSVTKDSLSRLYQGEFSDLKTVSRKTCPCNVYPLKPHFYIAKQRYAGLYLFFLFLLQNIDCGYSLEPPLSKNK